MQRTRTITALVSALLLLAGSAGCAGRPLVESVDAKGRSLVLLLDSSASMADTDPSRAAFTGASLVCALAGQHDNIGVIAFNSRARVVVPLRPDGLAPTRETLRAALSDVSRQGSTDFGIALEAAFSMLDAGKAPTGSSAILLTDGLPTGRVNRFGGEFSRGPQDAALAIPESVQRFASRGWRIFAIVFGPEAPLTRTYLTQLVGPTGGAILEAKDSAGLLPAFQAVSIQALGYISADQLSGEIVVPPDSRRLAVLSLFDKGEGELGALTLEGKPLDADKVIRFPQGRAAFGCALVEDPTPGSYRIEIPPGSSGLTLLEPAWYLELEPGAPPIEVASGSRVPVRARVRSGSASGGAAENEAAFARVRDRLTCELEIRRAGKVLATIAIPRAPGAELRFEGGFLAPAEAEPITVTVSAKLVVSGHTFASQRSVAVNVKAGGATEKVSAPSIAVPSRVDLAGFAGEELRATFPVDGDAKSAVICDVQASAGFTVSPSRLDLAPGGHASVEVRAASGTRSGGSVTIVARTSTAGVEPARREVAIGVSRGVLLATSVDMGSVSPGQDAEGALEAPGCTITTPALKGPGGASVALEWKGAKLVAHTSGNTPAGAYTAKAEARSGVSVRAIQVTLAVSAPTPSRLDLAATWGWASASFNLPAAGATFELEPLILDGAGAQIDPDLDIRTVDKGGGHYELRVFTATTLPAGRYTGVFKASCGGQERVLPVKLEVTR